MQYCQRSKHPDYDRVQQFLRAIESVSRSFGLNIAHEDSEGEFEIEVYSEAASEKLYEARIMTRPNLQHE